MADYGASLAEPSKVEKAGTTPGLGQISSLIVVGDWSDKPVDVVLSRIALVPPTDEIRAGRARLKRNQGGGGRTRSPGSRGEDNGQEEAAGHRRAAPCGRPGRSRHVCAVAPDVIAITLQAGQHVSNQLVPYVAEQGDEIVEEEKDKPIHEVRGRQGGGLFPERAFPEGQRSTAPSWGCSLPTESGFSSNTRRKGNCSMRPWSMCPRRIA